MPIADVLSDYDPQEDYPSEAEIRESCRVRDSEKSFYHRLRTCVKDRAQVTGRDPVNERGSPDDSESLWITHVGGTHNGSSDRIVPPGG